MELIQIQQIHKQINTMCQKLKKSCISNGAHRWYMVVINSKHKL